MRAPLLLLLTVGLAGCDNMQHQANRRPLTPTPLFSDGTSARTPPAHTVPIAAPAPSPASIAGTALDRLKHGQELYNADCAPCHGEDGYGTGIVVRRGFPAPPSFHSDRERALSDAAIAQVIRHGKGVMYPYGDKFLEPDIRLIVRYIRALQLSQHAAISDLSDEDKKELAGP